MFSATHSIDLNSSSRDRSHARTNPLHNRAKHTPNRRSFCLRELVPYDSHPFQTRISTNRCADRGRSTEMCLTKVVLPCHQDECAGRLNLLTGFRFSLTAQCRTDREQLQFRLARTGHFVLGLERQCSTTCRSETPTALHRSSESASDTSADRPPHAAGVAASSNGPGINPTKALPATVGQEAESDG